MNAAYGKSSMVRPSPRAGPPPRRAGAILALVGLINLPIIHYSVEWWNTLHQGSSLFAKGGPAMSTVFLAPLLLMSLAYMAAFGSLWLVGIRGEVWRRRAEAAALRAAVA